LRSGIDIYIKLLVIYIKFYIEKIKRKNSESKMIGENMQKITVQYSWPDIIDQYENFILNCFQESER